MTMQEEHRLPRKLTEAVAKEWEARKAKIEREIGLRAGPPWAGDYYYGDGLGVDARLTLAPRGGFLFLWMGCRGVCDRNFGEIEVEKSGLIGLPCPFSTTRGGFGGIAERLRPISWGGRRYLVADDDNDHFCNAINSGDEPRMEPHGLFFLLRGGGGQASARGP